MSLLTVLIVKNNQILTELALSVKNNVVDQTFKTFSTQF